VRVPYSKIHRTYSLTPTELDIFVLFRYTYSDFYLKTCVPCLTFAGATLTIQITKLLSHVIIVLNVIVDKTSSLNISFVVFFFFYFSRRIVQRRRKYQTNKNISNMNEFNFILLVSLGTIHCLFRLYVYIVR
jgi:hypothetical protein